MSNRPFITVMILCYNCGHLVDKALNAAASQTFHDFDLLFIDNGSTDNSRAVFDDFVANNQNIRAKCITIQENQGPTRGWNEGLKNAEGEYVIFNDADDWMDEDCLHVLAQKAKETGADRVTGQYREVTPDGKTVRERKIVSVNSRKLPTAMLQGTIFRRRTFLDSNLLFPEYGNVVAYDFEIVYKFSMIEKNDGQVVQKTIYNYLINPQSVIQTFSSADNAIRYQKKVTEPLIDMASAVSYGCMNKELSERMIYLVIRNYYPRILSLYQKLDAGTAKMIYKEMHAYMSQKLPSYTQNQFLIPFRNGYEQPGSFLIWILSKLENVHLLIPAARFASITIKKTKFLR